MLEIRTCLLAALVAGCGSGYSSPSPAPEPAVNALSSSERDSGWRLLFDGRTTAGWRAYDRPEMPGGWQVVDGALTRAARGGGDIITSESFRNFDLSLDWKLQPGGNSGIFYRAALGSDAIYFSAPEMQVLDDSAHADGRSELTSAGAVYGLYPARRGIVRPVGEWNTARILVNGNHVEHWLNGQQIAAYELGSEDWRRRVNSSKFKAWREYGQAAEGYIGLQDHGDWVAFRNIKIRVLP
jgi:hypothetical protein